MIRHHDPVQGKLPILVVVPVTEGAQYRRRDLTIKMFYPLKH